MKENHRNVKLLQHVEISSVQEKIRLYRKLLENLDESNALMIDHDEDDSLEFIINAGMQRYLQKGVAPEEARKLIENALDEPLEFEFPSFDEL